MKKIIVFIWIVFILTINNNINKLEANTEKLPVVTIDKVKKAFISESFIVTARIAPFESDVVSVKIFGPVETVYVEVGDYVKEGESLLKIETDELKADKKICATASGVWKIIHNI